jgi:hypothetical protein
MAMQRLQDKSKITFFSEKRDELVAGPFDANDSTPRNALESVEQGLEMKTTSAGVQLVRQRMQPVLRADESVVDDPDWYAFCDAFRLDSSLRTFDLTSGGLDPYLKDAPASGLHVLDLETRSLLQVLFFVSQGVQVPAEHLECGIATRTRDYNGQDFDWQQVLGGLFRVCCVQSKRPPKCAHIAIQYKGYWFYIDERDLETKSTFALLLEVSRLELESKKGNAPILTLPLGG